MNLDDIIAKAPLIRQDAVKNIIKCNAQSVQVAGTNGKGSTCAFLSSVLQSHGKRVGLYVSPHITDICERISVNGVNICREDFERLVSKVNSGQDGMCKSDLMFFSAVEYFNEKQVDFAVFETGLGGTRDSATLIDHKYGIITQIGLDHTEYLGDTVEEITAEKAGIIKPQMHIYAYPNATDYIIRQKCKEKAAEFNGVQPGDVTKSAEGFSVKVGKEVINNIKLAMAGEFQGLNCWCALNCAKDMLKEEFNPSIAKNAVETTVVYGRITVICTEPKVYADVSHNFDGVDALCKFISTLEGKGVAVASIKNTKDYKSMANRLKQTFERVVFTCADGNAVRDWPTEEFIKTPEQAYETVAKEGYDYIVFCGSFAIVKRAREMFG